MTKDELYDLIEYPWAAEKVLGSDWKKRWKEIPSAMAAKAIKIGMKEKRRNI